MAEKKSFKNILVVGGGAILFLTVVFLTFYFGGLKKYGSPSEYRAQQFAIIQAREDSLRAIQVLTPEENVADSTLFGISVQSKILEDYQQKEAELKAIQVSIDSLQKLKAEVEEKEKSVDMKQEELQTGIEILQGENAAKMALLYDSMKPQMALPLFLVMNDTLAVRIISNMQERTAARLLGMIAENDVEKATRLNKLLSMDEVAE